VSSSHRPNRLTVLVATAMIAGLVAVATPLSAHTLDPATVFFNEIHYDNTGTDAGEAIEVAGPAGTDLTGWSIVLYNGANGLVYDTDLLTGVIPDQDNGFGTIHLTYPVNGIQNGSPDGMALVAPGDVVVQFLSYEGTFTAVDGPAIGLLSTDIGVSETGTEPLGQSLQLVGTGTVYQDFTWAPPAVNTFGAVNTGQSFGDAPPPDLFFNEIHYDNTGTDAGEAIEVAGPAGTDLTGWSIVLYNGSDGAPYNTTALSGVTPDQDNGFGTIHFEYPVDGIQDGSPDGMALVAPGDVVVQFLSYEGTFTAVDGPAIGLLSTDIGVSETGTEPLGQSLQLVGTGTVYQDFTWTAPAAHTFGTVNTGQSFGDAPPPRVCPAPPEITLISQVQGSGETTPCAGETVVIEGVVVGDYEGPAPNLRGFYVQEEDEDQDGDPTTSEGIFVFNFDNNDVDLGDLVRVTGSAAEFQGQTQLGFPDEILTLGSRMTVIPTSVTIPFASADFLERYEGMLVTFPQTLYVTEFFQLGRFGEIVVSSEGKLAQPTNVVAPGAPANALQAANNLNRLKVDDNLNNQNPDPILFGRGGDPLSASNTLRGGDTLTGAVGVLTYGWAGNSASPNAYRLRVVGDLSDSGLVAGGVVPEFEAVNPRPTTAPEVGGSVEVASFNVLNYFLTLDTGGNLCGPIGFQQDCRGAESELELQRQRDKILAALIELDSDVLGLIEMENTTGVEPMADIVEGLNAALGAGTYDYVDTGTIGNDVIKVGLIYKPAAVTPMGSHAILDSEVDPGFDDEQNRPALAQTLVENESGEVFTVVVNHFKSKGSCPLTGPDADQGDGQSCWNATRLAAAEAMVDWLAGHPTGVADDDVLVAGDLNSYAMEDPIGVFEDAGYVNLVADFDGPDAYTFVFDGQWGYLDHSLASPSLFGQVTGTAVYHINADEPSVLDYNTNFKSPGQIESLYAPDEFRASDHDPVVVGLGLDFDVQISASPDTLWPPNHRYRSVTVRASIDGTGLAVEILDVTSSEADSGLGEGDLPNDIVITGPDTVDLRAERFSRQGRFYTVFAMVSGEGQVTFGTVVVVVPFNQRGRHRMQ
jgi:predicted extracellular nuclease